MGFCLSGASPRARCDVASANQGRQDGIPAVHRAEAEAMEEETAHPDHMVVRTGYLLDNTEQWDDGADGEAFL